MLQPNKDEELADVGTEGVEAGESGTGSGESGKTGRNGEQTNIGIRLLWKEK